MRLRALSFAVAAVSLVLCVATAALWVRSHVVADQWIRPRPGGDVAINSDRGTIVFLIGTDPSIPAGPASWHWYKAYGGTYGGGFDAAAVGASDNTWTVGAIAYRQRAWWAAHWVILLATAIAPAARFATWWPGRRAARLRTARLRGQCPACGYDLRASPDRCPECGTPATAE